MEDRVSNIRQAFDFWRSQWVSRQKYVKRKLVLQCWQCNRVISSADQSPVSSQQFFHLDSLSFAQVQSPKLSRHQDAFCSRLIIALGRANQSIKQSNISEKIPFMKKLKWEDQSADSQGEVALRRLVVKPPRRGDSSYFPCANSAMTLELHFIPKDTFLAPISY
jgi:hypothetical protein